MSTPSWKRALASRLPLAGVWILIIALWELAYRTIGWKPWIFPAPSHVLDATLALLNIRTAFGEPGKACSACHDDFQLKQFRD